MKTLTATLEASQKKPHRLPYVEAKERGYPGWLDYLKDIVIQLKRREYATLRNRS